jgi:hypothetical protein
LYLQGLSFPFYRQFAEFCAIPFDRSHKYLIRVNKQLSEFVSENRRKTRFLCNWGRSERIDRDAKDRSDRTIEMNSVSLDGFYFACPCKYSSPSAGGVSPVVRVIDFTIQENSNLKAMKAKRNLKDMKDKRNLNVKNMSPRRR